MTGRDRTVVIVVGVLVAIVASWMLVISPKRDQASKLGSQIQSVQASLASAQSLVSQGEAARAAFQSSYGTMVKLGEAVPTDDDVPSLIYQIQSAASAAGVDFQGLTLVPAAGATTTATTPPAASGSTGSTGSTPSSSTPPAATLPPGAAIGSAGFPVEPFTFTFQGNFFHLASFFGRLQRFVIASKRRVAVSGRLLTLNSISLTPGPTGFPQIAATVSATTYLLPSAEGLVAGATPAGPAASSPQPVSTPAASSPSTPPAAVVSAK